MSRSRISSAPRPGLARILRGITLVEALITLAIVVIITAISAPNLSTMLKSRQAKNAAQDLETMLELARSEAVRLARTVSLCPSTNGTSCTGAGSTNWRTGWLLFDDVNSNGSLDSGADGLSVLRVQGAMASTLTFTGPASVTFRSVGQAAASGSFSVSDGSTAGTFNICLLVSGSSSVKTTAC